MGHLANRSWPGRTGARSRYFRLAGHRFRGRCWRGVTMTGSSVLRAHAGYPLTGSPPGNGGVFGFGGCGELQLVATVSSTPPSNSSVSTPVTCIGHYTTFTPSVGGRLYVSANDPAAFADNSGGWRLSVSTSTGPDSDIDGCGDSFSPRLVAPQPARPLGLRRYVDAVPPRQWHSGRRPQRRSLPRRRLGRAHLGRPRQQRPCRAPTAATTTPTSTPTASRMEPNTTARPAPRWASPARPTAPSRSPTSP